MAVDYQAMAERLMEDYYAVTTQAPLRHMDSMKKGEGFVLAYVYHQRQALPTEMAAAMGTSTAHMTKILNGMERKQLIRRSLDTMDRRRILVCLTEEGTQAAREAYCKGRDCAAAMLERLGPEDAATLLRLLEKLRACHDSCAGMAQSEKGNDAHAETV